MCEQHPCSTLKSVCLHVATNHQNQHAPLNVGANCFIDHFGSVGGAGLRTNKAANFAPCAALFTRSMCSGGFKCSCMALAWSEMCMPHLHRTFVLSFHREQNGCRAKWEQKCNTQVIYCLD